jgi:hypothetical protein
MLTVIIASLCFTVLRSLRRVGTMKVLVSMFYTGAGFQQHHKYMCCGALHVVQCGKKIRR